MLEITQRQEIFVNIYVFIAEILFTFTKVTICIHSQCPTYFSKTLFNKFIDKSSTTKHEHSVTGIRLLFMNQPKQNKCNILRFDILSYSALSSEVFFVELPFIYSIHSLRKEEIGFSFGYSIDWFYYKIIDGA